MSKLEVDAIEPQSGTTLTLGASGDSVALGSGASVSGLTLSDNIVFNTASKGIYLGVTSATASNLLDDYEEGTWTPSFVAGLGPSGTITSITGTYTKVGRIVTLSMRVDGTSLDAPSYMRATGMPFSVSSYGTGTYIIGGINSRVHGWTLLAGISEWYLSPSGTVSAVSMNASVTYYTT